MNHMDMPTIVVKSGQDVLRYLVPVSGQFLVFDDSRLAVDLQPDGIPVDVFIDAALIRDEC